jgi:O-methyltransferase involved in polyketide biosynthesis
MKGNEGIGISGEMVALMKAQRKRDPYSGFFVTPRVRFLSGCVGLIIPHKLNEIYDKRLALSDGIRRYFNKYDPEQVIELGAGGSVFGFQYALNHPSVNYVDTDLPGVINFKKRVFGRILKNEGVKLPENYHLLSLDVLSEDIHTRVRPFLKRGKRTLLIAEGLTTYFDPEQYGYFMGNVEKFVSKTGSAYLSHEPLRNSDESVTSGRVGRALRSLVSLLTRSKSNKHFSSKEELIDFLKQRGFDKATCSVLDGNVIYLAE